MCPFLGMLWVVVSARFGVGCRNHPVWTSFFATLPYCDTQNVLAYVIWRYCHFRLVWEPVVRQHWMTRTRRFPAKAFVCGTGVYVSVCMFVRIYRLSESVCTWVDALKAHCCHWSARIHYIRFNNITIATVVPGCSLPPSICPSLLHSLFSSLLLDLNNEIKLSPVCCQFVYHSSPCCSYATSPTSQNLFTVYT